MFIIMKFPNLQLSPYIPINRSITFRSLDWYTTLLTLSWKVPLSHEGIPVAFVLVIILPYVIGAAVTAAALGKGIGATAGLLSGIIYGTAAILFEFQQFGVILFDPLIGGILEGLIAAVTGGIVGLFAKRPPKYLKILEEEIRAERALLED